MKPGSDTTAQPDSQPIMLAYAVVTMIVALPVYGFWRAFIDTNLTWLAWIQLAFLFALWLLPIVRKGLRPLRGFVLVSLVANAFGSIVIPAVSSSPVWASVFGPGASFFLSNLGGLLLKLASTVVLIGLLLGMRLHPREFFLVRGDSSAIAKKTRLLPGMRNDQPWRQLGRNITIGIFLVALILLVLLNLPRLGLDSTIKALPLLPAALLFAAINAFHEEFNFRAAPLSQLEPTLHSRLALAITVASFGLGHLVGSIPEGVIGVAVASYLGFIFGKAMLETRGFLWSWIPHFAANCAVFMLVAITSIAAVPG